ncbi:MAG TPA: SpoIIE family protein phosphatase [Kofleriaceae bacterium]|nr:SpoIIE family protein phosphatase [Kofleriaceae bacterium]
MQELWSSASYEPHLLSLLFAFAPASMLVVIAYGIAMRGEPVLRAWLLMHFVTLLPLFMTITLAPSIVSPHVATALFRISASCIPLTSVAGGAFQFSLIGKHEATRWYSLGFLVIACVWLVIGTTTDALCSGVRWLDGAGMWFGVTGDWAWLALLCVIASTLPSYVMLCKAAIFSKPSIERRQLRLVLIANVLTYAGIPVDGSLAFGYGVFPLSWLLGGIGSVLVARALVVEDLLRARAADTTAPNLVLHFAAAILLGWCSLELLGDQVPWWASAMVLAVCFGSVRVLIASLALINRGARGREGTLDRLLGQLVARARPLESEAQIAQLAVDIVELGLGTRAEVLLAASEDYGWSRPSGEKLDDADAPDPLLGAWLGEHRRALFSDELELHVPHDLREQLSRQFHRHQARALLPISSDGELLALLMVPATFRRVRGRELSFLERAGERFAEALVHARMAQRAAQRALLSRQVELAATVQAQLLPTKGPHVHGDITVVGTWLPASRCAGDFWGVYPLGERRVLVAIGDVAGHGIASSMVTAAAAAAVDVAVRRYGKDLELTNLITALDAAVRRVGGGQLSMTAFAAVLDPDAREIRFISCGHTTPYLVRPGDELELQALVGRGNPLGGGGSVGAKVLQKPLKAGDLVVWYTDGVIEAQDAGGEAFGDRRLQRMLRRLDRAQFTAPAVHNVLYASVAAHRSGVPREDDETLVVAQFATPRAASTEAAQ